MPNAHDRDVKSRTPPGHHRQPPDRLPVLVLDFDGVLCDSLEECMTVAWYAHGDASVEAFLDPGLAGVPAAVVARFRSCRPFMRHLLHFLVPIVETEPTTTRAAFQASYRALPSGETERFACAAERYRQQLRRTYPDQWNARHGIESRLSVLMRDAYVATARDSGSVAHILGAHDMRIHEERVFGSLRSKPAALDVIAMREGRSRADVVLVDDSIENCIAAREAGFAANWAVWGYHAPEDAEIARRSGIPALTVQALLQQRSSR